MRPSRNGVLVVLALLGVLLRGPAATAQTGSPVGPDRIRPHDSPRLALVGTVTGGRGIAVFVTETTRTIVLLRTGDGHAGWTLRKIDARAAVLDRDDQTVRLALRETWTPPLHGQPADRVLTSFGPPPNIRPASDRR